MSLDVQTIPCLDEPTGRFVGPWGEPRAECPMSRIAVRLRLTAYWRFEQAGDGVIVECESVSLSRSVPALLRPVAGPLISRVARESLERTLREVRAVVPGTP
ncbi:MAG: hypothetical protein H0X67_16560 [Acidobacteria bacterium]|nr:hypothetical protein [Acidobacteriota bacterium]